MAQAVPQTLELMAPTTWRTVDFISDLHLHPGEPGTFEAWQHYMRHTPADAVFILGDLFEVWVGDDAVTAQATQHPHGFEDQCAGVLRQTADRLPVFFMHGNRDFLVGPGLMGQCHTRLLADPTVLIFPASTPQRWLLSHGDALCLNDVDYLKFRAQVRTIAWQQAFLAKTLTERQAIARGLRQQSEARKLSGAAYADVDANLARQWLTAANAPTLIHGHTHQPADHDLGGGLSRVVLSDWDLQAQLPRAQVLRLSAEGMRRVNLTNATA